MSYYRVLRDVQAPGLCFFHEPVSAAGPVDARNFTSCERFGAAGESLVLPVDPGDQPPFGFGAFDMPVLEPPLASKISDLAGDHVELVPVTADGQARTILNVLRSADCIDEERTIGDKRPTGTTRTDPVGRYQMILHLFLDPDRIAGLNIFRVDGWHIALIVSDTLVRSFTADQRRGVRFQRVT